MRNRQSLRKNTFYLYILTASNYFFGVVTIPFQTRILGPDLFGVIAFATAICVYFNLFLDFGFLLSGTKSVSEAVKNNRDLSLLLSSIIWSKLILFCALVVIFLFITLYVNEFQQYFDVLSLYLIVALLNSLLPDFLYRGLENMSILTYRAVITRGLFTLLIFIFLKKEEQYILIPLFQICGSFAAIVWTWLDIHNNLKINFVKTTIKDIKNVLRESSQYFLSRIATTIYNGVNTLIISFSLPMSIVGLYTSGTKFRTLLNQIESPICDSIYPYMTRTHDFKKFFKILYIGQIAVMLICIALFIWAKEICVIVFGDKFADAGIILRLTIPIMAFGYIGKMLGFPALTPIGLQKWANLSNVIAMINQLIVLSILFVFEAVNVRNLILATIMSEYIGIGVRVFVFSKRYFKYKRNND